MPAARKLSVDTSIQLRRLKELVDAGVRPRVANHLLICELALAAVASAPAAAEDLAPHVDVVLLDTATFEAAKAACVAPAHARAWQLLAAACTEQPVHARCLHLGQLCRRRALRVVAS
jgi:hypothetical protein